MKISEIYKKNKKSLSFEIFPPKKDSELRNIDETLAVLCELNPDYISVTFGAGGGTGCSRTIELARKIKYEYHVEPVVHLTCLHYDKTEIDGFARILENEGIQNVLALRGDKNPDILEKGDYKHASDLIAYMKPDTASCNLIPPIRGSAVGQSHHQEPNLPNLMAKPVDKARRIRYNFYGILCILSYLIIPWIADSSESVFCF